MSGTITLTDKGFTLFHLFCYPELNTSLISYEAGDGRACWATTEQKLNMSLVYYIRRKKKQAVKKSLNKASASKSTSTLHVSTPPKGIGNEVI